MRPLLDVVVGVRPMYGCEARLMTMVRPKAPARARPRDRVDAEPDDRRRHGADRRAVDDRERLADASARGSPTVRGMMRHDRNMMPSAKRPTSSSGCREFLRVIRLSVASSAASRAEAGNPQRGRIRNAGERDVFDDNPGEEGTRRQCDAGAEREQVGAHARPEDPAPAHFASLAYRFAAAVECREQGRRS